MRHYEIVLLVHPSQSEQVPDMLARYRSIVESNGGHIHRFEDWGRRQLTYTINKLHKAHYILLNIESNADVMNELVSIFRFNDAIIRHLVVTCDKAFKGLSPLMKEQDKAARREAERSKSVAEPTVNNNSATDSSDDKIVTETK